MKKNILLYYLLLIYLAATPLKGISEELAQLVSEKNNLIVSKTLNNTTLDDINRKVYLLVEHKRQACDTIYDLMQISEELRQHYKEESKYPYEYRIEFFKPHVFQHSKQKLRLQARNILHNHIMIAQSYDTYQAIFKECSIAHQNSLLDKTAFDQVNNTLENKIIHSITKALDQSITLKDMLRIKHDTATLLKNFHKQKKLASALFDTKIQSFFSAKFNLTSEIQDWISLFNEMEQYKTIPTIAELKKVWVEKFNATVLKQVHYARSLPELISIKEKITSHFPLAKNYTPLVNYYIKLFVENSTKNTQNFKDLVCLRSTIYQEQQHIQNAHVYILKCDNRIHNYLEKLHQVNDAELIQRAHEIMQKYNYI